MKSGENNKIELFLADITVIDRAKSEQLLLIRKLVHQICRGCEEEIKYGGLVFNMKSELICGIFIRQKHISLEFGLGSEFSDPKGHLEGAGKYRRHLKIRTDEDIKEKNVLNFLKQAFSQ